MDNWLLLFKPVLCKHFEDIFDCVIVTASYHPESDCSNVFSDVRLSVMH